MIDWALVATIVVAVLLSALALVLAWVVGSLIVAGGYIAWYFVFMEWPQTIMLEIQRRRKSGDSEPKGC